MWQDLAFSSYHESLAEIEHLRLANIAELISSFAAEADRLQSTRPLAMALWRTCRASALPATGARSSRKSNPDALASL
jgi:hypothetical protein